MLFFLCVHGEKQNNRGKDLLLGLSRVVACRIVYCRTRATLPSSRLCDETLLAIDYRNTRQKRLKVSCRPQLFVEEFGGKIKASIF